MARKLREHVADGIYHVYARGNNQQRIFWSDSDRRMYLGTLGRVTTRMEWNCLSYCLMGNHFHLLVETPLPNLGDGMKRLQGEYTQAINRKHRRSGHLYQGRYDAVRIKSDRQLFAVAQYIESNPVVAGISEQPDDWPWSSAHELHKGTAPRWLDDQRLQVLLGRAVG